MNPKYRFAVIVMILVTAMTVAGLVQSDVVEITSAVGWPGT